MLVGATRKVARRLVHNGPREVLWSPTSGLGFGNMLYAYLHASMQVSDGRQCRVLRAPVMDDWFRRFPRLSADLTIGRGELRWRDRRGWSWHDHYGRDFTEQDLQTFVDTYLDFTSAAKPPVAEHVVVNVRRGDYYEKPHFRGTYSFDIASYVGLALERCAAAAPVPGIIFVSDGLDWCRLKLDGLARGFTENVSYFDSDAVSSFELAASARRIVGTNSSFSYWAGYVSGVLHRSDSHVVMPRFHGRLGSDWSAYQLLPAWDVVDDIPGGWNA